MTTAVFAAECAQPGLDDRPLSSIAQASPPIVYALRYGITAPSAHNTQPWRIQLVSETEARLFFDPERMLPSTDPPGRQVHISHGTLLEMTAIAATHLGYRAEIKVLPLGEMSIAEFGTRPTAIVQLAPQTSGPVDPLFAQVLGRRSSRLQHHGPFVTEHEFQSVSAQTNANTDQITVGRVPHAKLPKALDIVDRAMTIEVEDFELYDETRLWFRYSDREIDDRGDGLNFRTAGLSGWRLSLARRFVKPKSWHSKSNRKSTLESFRKAIQTTRGLLTIVTSTNTMHDWIATGRVYLRAQLAASALGLRFHPVSQSLQEYPEMEELRGEVNALVGVEAPAKLQMLVRIGRTKFPALSPRRSLDAIVADI